MRDCAKRRKTTTAEVRAMPLSVPESYCRTVSQAAWHSLPSTLCDGWDDSLYVHSSRGVD